MCWIHKEKTFEIVTSNLIFLHEDIIPIMKNKVYSTVLLIILCGFYVQSSNLICIR